MFHQSINLCTKEWPEILESTISMSNNYIQENNDMDLWMFAGTRHNWGRRKEELLPWSSQEGNTLTLGPAISETLGS